MSVIAWDGATVAADRQATEDSIRSICKKIERVRCDIVGTVGDVDYGTRLVKWYRGKSGEKAFPKQKHGEDATLIVFAGDGHVYEYGANGDKVPVHDKFMAWGTGKDLALGAMAMGATAAEAVKIASKYHVGCGMGVTVLRPRN